MHTDKQTPADSAQTVAACECEFTNPAAPDGMNTLYIIPGYNSRITETEYTQFHTAITQLLQEDKIQYISLGEVMQSVAGQNINNYSDVIEKTASICRLPQVAS